MILPITLLALAGCRSTSERNHVVHPSSSWPSDKWSPDRNEEWDDGRKAAAANLIGQFVMFAANACGAR